MQDIAVIGQKALKAVGYLRHITYSQNAIGLVVFFLGGGGVTFSVDCRFGPNVRCDW